MTSPGLQQKAVVPIFIGIDISDQQAGFTFSDESSKSQLLIIIKSEFWGSGIGGSHL